MRTHFPKIIALFALALAALVSLAPLTTHTTTAQTSAGTIAYAPADTSDEIRLIEPNGSNDRLLWAHGQPDQYDTFKIWSIDWRPDARELAFASTHERECSLHEGDIFVVRADGNNLRRITEAPSCAALAAYPKGTVQVPVQNSSSSSVVAFVYFQGAPTYQQVSLPPFGTGVVTFNNVADFGPGVLQHAVLIQGVQREINQGTSVDVQTNGTVRTGVMGVRNLNMSYYKEAFAPTWRHDGSKIGYVDTFNTLLQLSPNPRPLEKGVPLQTNQDLMPDFVNYLAWGPTPATANQILYTGFDYTNETGVYRITEGSSTAGEPLVTYPANASVQAVRGLAWLPDGSGFIFALEETEFYSSVRANIFEYNFASKQVKRVTNFSNEFAGQLSVSPDGQQIVFERAKEKAFGAPSDLWIVNRDGSGLRLLKQNAARPDWSPSAIPAQLSWRVYLPFIQR